MIDESAISESADKLIRKSDTADPLWLACPFLDHLSLEPSKDFSVHVLKDDNIFKNTNYPRVFQL